MDVYTIGGGEIVYEVLKAVAMCLNGGSGTLQALLRIGGFFGAFIVYYLILYGSPTEVFKNWGMPVILITTMLFVPTSTVWVKDTITRYHYKIDNVPYGLALFSSQISKLGLALTDIVEQSFSTPDDLKYQKTGMMFGSDILERAKTFRITNANFKENFRNFVGQCVKYDIMLNQKYSFDDLKNSNSIWDLITKDPSKNRGIYWLPLIGKGVAQYVTCAGAVEKFNQAWAAELDRSFAVLSLKFFTGRFIANSGSTTPKFVMSSQLQDALKSEMKKNLFNVSSYLGDIAISAEDTLKQSLIINGIADSASENSKLAGTYAEARALEQQHITFDTIGRLAPKFLPIMKAIIEALAYTCFIFIIPLCMIPNGYKFLLNWISVLVWLQAWAPMYAILNYIMNIAARASTISEIGTAGGLTIANYIGVADANSEIKLLAGYLVMSVPFICIAIVKGLGSFIHLASQMTGTSMQVAGTAGGEVATGNFSFGNINMRNQSYDNFSQLQRNFSSSLAAGGHRLDTGGIQITNDAYGAKTFNQAISHGVRNFDTAGTQSMSNTVDINKMRQQAEEEGIRLNELQSTGRQEIERIANSMTKMTAMNISSKYGKTAEEAKNILQTARNIDSYHTGHNYNDQTHASGGLSFGVSAGNSNVKGEGETLLGKINGIVNGYIGGNFATGVQATNSTNKGDSHSGISTQEYNESLKTLEAFSEEVAKTNRQDELTQLAKDHQRTIQDMTSLSKDKAAHERYIQNYQEAQHYGNSYTFTDRIDHTTEVWQIGREVGYSEREAIDKMGSSNSADQEMVDSWKKKFEEKNKRTMTPNRPSAPTQNSVFKGNEFSKAQTKLEQKYEKERQKSEDGMAEIGNGMKEVKENSQRDNFEVHLNSRFNVMNTSINAKKEQVTNDIRKTKAQVQKRGEKFVVTAAKDKIFGNDDK